MKIKDIKSDEVREEAVMICVERNPSERNKDIALEFDLLDAFRWDITQQGLDFWQDLYEGIEPNTPNLKLPKK
jgi:hypothetical protein